MLRIVLSLALLFILDIYIYIYIKQVISFHLACINFVWALFENESQDFQNINLFSLLVSIRGENRD